MAICLEISTAHITEKDNEELSKMAAFVREPRSPVTLSEPINVGELEYGYAIVLPQEEEYFNMIRENCEELEYAFSESFWQMMKYAFDNRYRAILLDRDADVVEGLTVNDW